MDREYIDQKLNEVNKRLDALVEINETLIKQNLTLSEKAFGKIEQQNSPQKEFKKKLYYTVEDDCVFISGSGTFDSKDKLKEIRCEWNGASKSWKSSKTLAEIKVIFPEITEKP